MTSQELRLGNKIKDRLGRFLTVETVKPNGARCLYVGQQNTYIPGIRNSLFALDDLNGIPLTLDILEKCGFGIAESSTSADHKSGCFSLSNPLLLVGKGEWTYQRFVGGINPQIKYLHQLQNCFYAMIGIELKCNI